MNDSSSPVTSQHSPNNTQERQERENMTQNEGANLISEEGYLDSVRSLGLTTTDAISELIDNSFDADATEVKIHIIKSKNDKICIAVEDDGVGIAPEKIPKALSFGGRVHNGESKSSPIGKFGWGLSSSACCQSPNTAVHSKIPEQEFYAAYLNLEDMKAKQKMKIDPAVPAEPPSNEFGLELTGKKSGTVVVLRDCDNLEATTVNGLVNLLVGHIGEVHRKYLASGRRITVNGKDVQVVDPLMWIPNSMYMDTIGKGREYARIDPIIVPEVIDPSTGKPAEIIIKISMLDIERIWDNEKPKAVMKKAGISMERQGFYLMRHNRQIVSAQTFNLFQKHNSLNYFRGEISFPPCLDYYFGIQTNKARCSLKGSVKDRISDSLKGVLKQLGDDTKKIMTSLDQQRSKDDVRASEKIAAKASAMLKRGEYEPTPEQIAAAEAEARKEMEAQIKLVEVDPKIPAEEKPQRIKQIENRFQFKRPYKMVLDYIESGNFYLVHSKGRDTEVVINTAHPFYDKVYERAVERGLDTYIDLLLFALAKAEIDHQNSDELRRFYQQQRGEWSASLLVFLDEVSDAENGKDLDQSSEGDL